MAGLLRVSHRCRLQPGRHGRPAPRVNGTAANPMIPISRQVERSSTPQATPLKGG
jgi:hypothetical protein